MRAILKNDIILKLTSKPNIGIEVGNIPPGKSLDVLRFDGNKVVDLTTLNEMYVDKHGVLHCVQVPGSQLVQMTYSDRKRLKKTNGRWVVKTPQEIEIEKREAQKNTLYKNRVKRYPEIGDQMDALLKYMDTGDDTELRKIITKWKAVKDEVIIPTELRKV